MAYAEAEATDQGTYAMDWRDFAIWCHARGATPLPAHRARRQRRRLPVSHLASTGWKSSTIGRKAAQDRRPRAADQPGGGEGGPAWHPPHDRQRDPGQGAGDSGPYLRRKPARPPRWASLTLGFAEAFRRSELAVLHVADLTEVENGLPCPDPAEQRRPGRAGAGGGDPARLSRLRPVEAVKVWRDAAVTEGRLFRAVANGVTEAMSTHSLALAVKRRLRGAATACAAGRNDRIGRSTTPGQPAFLWRNYNVCVHSLSCSFATGCGHLWHMVDCVRTKGGSRFVSITACSGHGAVSPLSVSCQIKAKSANTKILALRGLCPDGLIP
jgi:hypothetical protein